jgi:hypothetical protein
VVVVVDNEVLVGSSVTISVSENEVISMNTLMKLAYTVYDEGVLTSW